MFRHHLAALLAAFALAPAAGQAADVSPEDRYVLYRGATLIDGTGADPRPDMTVLVKGERIERIWRGNEVAYKLPQDAQVVDAKGLFVLPGLVDSHEHLATPPARAKAEALMKRDLYSGITAIRDMADDMPNVADLSRASRVREIPGPDIYYEAIIEGQTFFQDRR